MALEEVFVFAAWKSALKYKNALFILCCLSFGIASLGRLG